MSETISIRARIQAFGGFLTNMVMPNIGAFIAWGIATALFIPTGWLPNESLGKLVEPTIKYLLPVLLAYSGGAMIANKRGAVLATIGAIGLIIGSSIPMFLGAMIIGPLCGIINKKIDEFLENKIPTGFEMVINNFVLGIVGFIIMVLSYLVIGPMIEGANNIVIKLIEALVSTGFLPLLSIINEPAKVLFLNNVIDQGIYYPLGMQAALEGGKSIYFMVASNPGTGLGLLLAYTIFGNATAKRTAPGAIIIHFFGGIHELYFPYVLMKPFTIIAMIAGGMTGTFTFQLFNVGLVAGPSPGSIFAYLALTPKGNFIGVIAGVLSAAVVSFLITSLILKLERKNNEDEEDLEKYQEMSKNMKEEGKIISYNRIAFSCDAGVGSSAFGATSFKKRLQQNGIENIEVKNYRIEDIPENINIIVVHENLADRVRLSHKNKKIIAIKNYLNDPEIDNLLNVIVEKNKKEE